MANPLGLHNPGKASELPAVIAVSWLLNSTIGAIELQCQADCSLRTPKRFVIAPTSPTAPGLTHSQLHARMAAAKRISYRQRFISLLLWSKRAPVNTYWEIGFFRHITLKILFFSSFLQIIRWRLISFCVIKLTYK
jgi:hypothetical protein